MKKRMMARRILCFAAGLSLAAPALRAGEKPTDGDSMLKVPPAETRDAGDGPAPSSPAPSPETAPPIPEEPAPAENAGAPAEGGVVLPAFPLSRYEPLWERSPFQLESVAPPVESAGIAQRFALTGLAEINGEPIAFIMDRATQNRLMVKKDSRENGVSLVQVDLQKKYIDSTATLRQGAEIGVVRFDAGGAPGAGTVPPPMAQPAMPIPRAMPPGMPGIPPQAAVPQIPQVPGQAPVVPGVTQAPGIVPPVPGPGISQDGQQVQGGNGQMPPPRVIRRRALIPAAP